MNASNPCRRFPRSARVRTRAQYTIVFDTARRTSDPLLSLHWRTGDTPPRLGMAVSRKVDTRAVGRNRIKRVLRDAMRHLLPELAGGDYV
ncbi:ribonuclease P protein component, partial [Xanthomonas euvesicatoria]